MTEAAPVLLLRKRSKELVLLAIPFRIFVWLPVPGPFGFRPWHGVAGLAGCFVAV